MKRRILSCENEWTAQWRPDKNSLWRCEIDPNHFNEIARALVNQGGVFDGQNNAFHRNGSRCYIDVNNHLEIALPECNNVKEVLKYEKWSERFIVKLVKKLAETQGEFIFYKKNTDSNTRQSRGAHENYLSEKFFEELLSKSQSNLSSDSKKFLDRRINFFILFLVTRQIFTGSGGIMLYRTCKTNSDEPDNPDTYEISPRTYHIQTIIGGSTTSARPIIHIRREALADEEKYFRNHLILGDANMADLSIFLKLGTTSGIIEMIEEGAYDENLGLADILEAVPLMRKISKDLTLQSVPIKLLNGEEKTVIEVQEMYQKLYERYLAQTTRGGEKAEINARWKDILERLKIDDEMTYHWLDWKIKRRMVYHYMEKHGLDFERGKIKQIDLQYHDPNPQKSLYYLAKNRPGSHFEDMVSEEEIIEADKTPPNNRARLRNTIKRLLEKRVDLRYCYFEWNKVSYMLSGSSPKTILLPDPFANSIDHLEEADRRALIAAA